MWINAPDEYLSDDPDDDGDGDNAGCLQLREILASCNLVDAPGTFL